MAVIQNTVPISGMLAPTGTTDVYATHDALYGKDGLRVVTSIIERDAIPAGRRRAGMIVGVDNDDTTFTYYKLKKVNWDYTANDWEVWNLGTSVVGKQIAFGNVLDSIASSDALVWDYDTNTLKIKGSALPGVNILELNRNTGESLLTVDTNGITKFYDATDNTNYVGLKVATGGTATTYTLPPNVGTPGQALITDGSGILNWGLLTADGNRGYSEILISDGSNNTWTVVHNLNSINVMVQMFENVTYKNIEVEIIRIDVNTVQVNTSPALPSGNYTVLVASMIFSNISAALIGGVDQSIQFNKSSLLGGEDSFRYQYLLSNNSKKVQLTSVWGTDNTIANFETYVKNIGETQSHSLVKLGRNNTISSDPVPEEIREGKLVLYSTYPTVEKIKVELSGGGEGVGLLNLYENNSLDPATSISLDSYMIGSLTIGDSIIGSNTKLKIKTDSTVLTVYDGSDVLRMTILGSGKVSIDNTLKLGDVLEVDADTTPGTIRYDSSTGHFYGYTSAGWKILDNI